MNSEMSQSELDARLMAAQTPYGVGTRSYNRSPQKRELDRQCKLATERHVPEEIAAPLVCTCRSFRLPHPPARHGGLRSAEDWRPWQERYWLNPQYNSWEAK